MVKIFPVNIISKRKNAGTRLKLQNYSKEFYDAHPDFAPRGNLLLYYGKVAGRKEIDERFDSAYKITSWTKIKFRILNKAIDFLDWLEKKKP